MGRLFKRVIVEVDKVDSALGEFPDAPDGGIASELIGFTVAAAVEASGMTSDSYRAVIAVARDVLDDFTHNEALASSEMRSLKAEIGGK